MSWVIPPPGPVSVPVTGGGAFPVRHVWCVGRNYAEHAREMGAAPGTPIFFAKPAHALICAARVPYPPKTTELHHEVELVVALGAGGRNLSAEKARGAVFGYAVGVDLTRRDIQQQAKRNGHPWEMAKAFDASAPIGNILPAAAGFDAGQGRIELAVNAQIRQRGDLQDMLWSVPALIAQLSEQVALAPGDLIYSGTPSGVGAVQPGDRIQAMIAGLSTLNFIITPPLS